ncbi:MAG TPA: histidine kinase [Acidimicrobiales bacterium]|nr:histidine kinase [Acidimicrobiales bacterium]
MSEAIVADDHDEAATAPGHSDAAAAVAAASSPRRGGRSLPLLVALGFAGLSVAVVAHMTETPWSYAATSTPAAIIDLAAGLGLIVAGVAYGLARQRGSIGPLSAMIGVAWLSADWIGWADGPAITRSVAMVVAPFLLPLVVHLSVAFPTGRVTGRRARSLVALAYGVTASVSLAWALLRDPFLDRYCWPNCTDNSFLIRTEPDVTRSLTTLWLYFSVATALVLAASCAWWLSWASQAARRTLAPVLGPAALVAATQALYAGLLLADPAENPDRRAFAAVFLARAAALIALAAGITWAVRRGLRTQRSVARLADELGAAPPPGSLRAALARSLGDDRLEVAYWLPGPQAYIDARGQPVDPSPGPTQAVTPIERNGQPIAVVIHDRSLEASHDLEREIGAASRLAVDNERLRAQALAQLAGLRTSRARIVETADNTRRQLERNLHDGAQQRLLALSYELQLAEADARAAGDTQLAGVLTTAGEKASRALVELRDLAHGIFPVILTEAGLGPALATFVDTAPLRVELVDLPDERLPDHTETTTYLAVTAAVEHAARRSASRIVATFRLLDTDLEVELVDDGTGDNPDDLIRIRDRVGALGGRLDIDGTRIQMVIPCG